MDLIEKQNNKGGKEIIPALCFPNFAHDREWEVKRLGDCLIQAPDYGLNAPAVPYSVNLPTYLRITDISDDGYFIKEGKSSVDTVLTKENSLQEGDIVFARTGASVGKVYKYRKEDGPLVFAGFLIRIKPDNTKLDSDFLFQFLFSNTYKRWVDVTSTRSGQPGINSADIASLQIPLPLLAEQCRIAQAFNALDELIATTNGKLEQLKGYKKGLMQKLFPAKGKKLPELRFKEFEKDGEWEEKKLGEIVNVLDSQRKPVAKNERMRGKYPYYGANGIQDYVSDYIFDGSFLLMGEDGSVINKDGTPVLHWAEGRIWVNNHAHVMSENCNAAYLKYVFYVLSKVDVQSLVKGIPPKINQQNMRNILLLIPSLPEQEKIASCLSTLDEKINSYKEKIALLGQYKKGLMQQLFPTSK